MAARTKYVMRLEIFTNQPLSTEARALFSTLLDNAFEDTMHTTASAKESLAQEPEYAPAAHQELAAAEATFEATSLQLEA